MLGMYSHIETVTLWHLSLALYLKNFRKHGFSSGSCFIQDDDEIIVSFVCFLRDRFCEYLFHSDNAELQLSVLHVIQECGCVFVCLIR